MNKFNNIPTNIISGFLGAGKTTAIRYLLQQKPKSERWAVIVNEFGQVGIDGALLETEGVEIKEIPGGCLCCVGSQSLNVGLNQIIRQLKPHRILIEPTGLGHPRKLIETLLGKFYKDVLDLRAVINLLDARLLNDPRYMTHETFVAQLQIADVLVANKLDTYTEEDKQRFYDYALTCQPEKQKVVMVDHGSLLPEWLNIEHNEGRQVLASRFHVSSVSVQPEKTRYFTGENDNRSSHWLMVEGHSNGHMSTGWRIHLGYVFNRDELLNWILRLFDEPAIERVKGLMHTTDGWVSVNHTRHEHEVEKRQAHSSSILEIIATERLSSGELNHQLKHLA